MIDSITIFKQFNNKIALIDDGISYTYNQLIEDIELKRIKLQSSFASPVPVVLVGDFSFSSISWLFALLTNKYVVLLQVPSSSVDSKLISNAGIQATITSVNNRIEMTDVVTRAKSVQRLIDNNQGGILLMSSGTTGTPKLILHAANRLMSKYEYSRKAYSTLGFLLFDHIAGFDTLMYTLHAGGSLIVLPNRHVDSVLNNLKKYDINVLPTTPSFINLLLFESNFNSTYLPYLKIITFGSEKINEGTLNRLMNRFNKNIRFEQKYGLTELGSLVLKSNPDDPKWIKFDDRYASWKIIDNQLYIKTNSSLEAYIYPDSEDFCSGWFNTQDQVIVNGDWLQILGRSSEIINVGGQKVYPSEIESVIQLMQGVLQVVVSGVQHPIMGQVVMANIQLKNQENETEFRSKLRLFCKDKLESYKIPVIIKLSTTDILSERFKQKRSFEA